MKCKYLIFIILLLSSVVAAQVENYNDVQTLSINLIIQQSITVNYKTSSATLQSVTASIIFIPIEDTRQKIINLNTQTTPEGKVKQDPQQVTINWENTKDQSLSYKIQATVQTKNSFPKIKQKMHFPLDQLDQDVNKYTQPTEFIDLTPEIEAKAREIIGQDDDLFSVVFKLADWTQNNINYDLSTLTAEAVQKSSWVLSHKEGVCDEMTNLFISMLRSVGIPAKFISGMVYSNVGFTWGLHGWAEVYFPNVGWLPFDVTFQQYGWLDPSHMKLKENVDSGAPSSQYEWKGNDVDLKVGKLDIQAQVKESQGKIQSPITITAAPVRKDVGFGSFVPLQVNIENPNDFYVAPTIYVRKATPLTEKNAKAILLPPHTDNILYWIMQVPADLDKKFVYTSSLEVQSGFNDIAKTELKYADNFPFFSKEEAEKIVKKAQHENKQEISVELSCIPNQKVYYSNETAVIACTITNGQRNAKLTACIYERCTSFALNPGEAKEVDYKLQLAQTTRVPLVVSNELGFKTLFFPVTVIKIPDVYISDVSPTTIDYSTPAEITMYINAETKVYNLKINTLSNILPIGDFEGQKKMVISTDGRSMLQGLRLIITYTDEKGKTYNKAEAIAVKVENIPFYVKIVMSVINFFKNLF